MRGTVSSILKDKWIPLPPLRPRCSWATQIPDADTQLRDQAESPEEGQSRGSPLHTLVFQTLCFLKGGSLMKLFRRILAST